MKTHKPNKKKVIKSFLHSKSDLIKSIIVTTAFMILFFCSESGADLGFSRGGTDFKKNLKILTTKLIFPALLK